MPSSILLRQLGPGDLPYDLLLPTGGIPGLPASLSLQTTLADLLDSQHRLELAFQSASASPVQDSDTDAAAAVAAAGNTQAAIQVGTVQHQCMAESVQGSPVHVAGRPFRMLPCRQCQAYRRFVQPPAL